MSASNSASSLESPGTDAGVNIFVPNTSYTCESSLSTNENQPTPELYNSGLRRRNPNPFLSTISNFIDNTIQQKNVVECDRLPLTERLLNRVKSKRAVLWFVGISIFLVILFFLNAYMGTRHTINNVQTATLEDIKTHLNQFLVTAASTDHAYKKPSAVLAMDHLQNDVLPNTDLPLHIVTKKMAGAIVHTNTLCIAAPQVGYQYQILVINRLGELTWIINPVLLPLPFYTTAAKEVISHETSTLYPGAPSVDVIRHSKILVRGMLEDWNEFNEFLYDEVAICVQGAIQLMEGMTVYDLQTK